MLRWNTSPQYLALSVSGGATQMVGDLVSGYGVGHVQLLAFAAAVLDTEHHCWAPMMSKQLASWMYCCNT